MTKTLARHALACLLAGSLAGCATFQPSLAMTCRDPSTGRFVSCGGGSGGGGGGGPSEAVIILAVIGGLGLLAGGLALWANAQRSSTPSAPTASPYTSSFVEPPCALPAVQVRACESSRGYRFAVPMATACAAGSRELGAVPLRCEDLGAPAYHACLGAGGEWFAARSWESCESLGLTDAPGDFVPPGRTPEQGVARDSAASLTVRPGR